MLERALGRLVLFASVFQEFKDHSELAMQFSIFIPRDRKPAALLWPIGSKGRHDHLTSRLYHSLELLDMGQSIRRIGREVCIRAPMRAWLWRLSVLGGYGRNQGVQRRIARLQVLGVG
jgi:hypothetical protein